MKIFEDEIISKELLTIIVILISMIAVLLIKDNIPQEISSLFSLLIGIIGKGLYDKNREIKN
jgi:hypothetical protein